MEEFMKVIKCEVHNFASYKHLEFNFDDTGVVLIHGKTGSGKSTFMDIIPWVLFGRTAKNGAADDVLSWNSNEATKGVIWLDNGISVTRIRSKGGKQNDLYFTKEKVDFRGSNISDTQNLMGAELGIVLESFLTNSYYHEFASTAGFFTAGAKQRRSICESIAELQFSTSLASQLSDSYKIIRTSVMEVETDILAQNKQLGFLIRQEEQVTKDFKEKQTATIKNLNDTIASLESIVTELPNLKNQLQEIKSKDICPTCGHTTNNKEYQRVVNEVSRAEHAKSTLDRTRIELDHVLSQKQPKNVTDDIKELKESISKLTDNSKTLKQKLNDIEVLEDILQQYRARTIKNTIQQVETKTNDYLSKYFDAEISIILSAEDTDKIDIDIFKDGNKCSIGQLSKGQRTLLKFCFGVSVMQIAANHNGVVFKQLWFDEALDGLDDNLKLKTCNMLLALSLEYDTVYIVEHSSEMKAHLDNKYEVRLDTEGNSGIIS